MSEPSRLTAILIGFILWGVYYRVFEYDTYHTSIPVTLAAMAWVSYSVTLPAHWSIYAFFGAFIAWHTGHLVRVLSSPNCVA
jgi:hypothetical protein